MRGADRLAGQRPLDGRVRRRYSHSPDLHFALGGAVGKQTHLTSTCCEAAGACTACFAWRDSARLMRDYWLVTW